MPLWQASSINTRASRQSPEVLSIAIRCLLEAPEERPTSSQVLLDLPRAGFEYLHEEIKSESRKRKSHRQVNRKHRICTSVSALMGWRLHDTLH